MKKGILRLKVNLINSYGLQRVLYPIYELYYFCEFHACFTQTITHCMNKPGLAKMSKFMSRKGKEPKKPPKDPSNAAPALPDRLPPKPQAGGYSDQLPPLPAPPPPRSTSPYPGKWKPPAQTATQPTGYNLPQSNSNNSFDDEYVAPTELDNGTNDIVRIIPVCVW